jgi:hypothetical protein
MKKYTKDLTKVQGCYSKELREATFTIKLCLKENSVSVQDMINVVAAIIEPATIEAEAKKRFTNNLFDCKTKEEVDKLCHDAVIHGMYYRSTARV